MYLKILKANPYHDERGRFASKRRASFVSIGGVFDKQRQLAEARLSSGSSFKANDEFFQREAIASALGAPSSSLTKAQYAHYLDNGAYNYSESVGTGDWAKRREDFREHNKYFDKYRDAEGRFPDDLASKLTVEDMAHAKKYMDKGGRIDVDGLEKYDDVLKQSVRKLDADMPSKYTVDFSDDGAKILIDGLEGDLQSRVFRIRGQLNTPMMMAKSSGEEMDAFANGMKPTTAYALGVGMFHENRDVHKAHFWNTWAMAGGTTAHKAALSAMSDFGANSGLDLFAGGSRGGMAIGKQVPPPSKVIRNHLELTYKETQSFYATKYGTKVGSKSLTLYRGVALDGKASYVPSTIESWSTLKSTGTTFANMMAGASRKTPYVYKTSVPLSAVFASHETLGKWFTAEKNLKGKKEHILIGGLIKGIEWVGP